MLLCLFVTAGSVSAAQVGSDCTAKTRLSAGQMCYDGTVVDCTSPNGRNELLLCVDDQYRRTDAELNRLYQRILKQLNGSENAAVRSQLIEGQRAWVSYKKADCAIEEELMRGGSASVAAPLACETEVTKARIRVLQQRFGIQK